MLSAVRPVPLHGSIGAAAEDGSGHGNKSTLAGTDERNSTAQLVRLFEQSPPILVDTIPGLVCTLSAAGEVQLVNRQILDYFGKTTHEELTGGVIREGIHPDDLRRVADTWKRSVETGEAFELESRFL